jgi:hypothetical protein
MGGMLSLATLFRRASICLTLCMLVSADCSNEVVSVAKQRRGCRRESVDWTLLAPFHLVSRAMQCGAWAGSSLTMAAEQMPYYHASMGMDGGVVGVTKFGCRSSFVPYVGQANPCMR